MAANGRTRAGNGLKRIQGEFRMAIEPNRAFIAGDVDSCRSTSKVKNSSMKLNTSDFTFLCHKTICLSTPLEWIEALSARVLWIGSTQTILTLFVSISF